MNDQYDLKLYYHDNYYIIYIYCMNYNKLTLFYESTFYRFKILSRVKEYSGFMMIFIFFYSV